MSKEKTIQKLITKNEGQVLISRSRGQKAVVTKDILTFSITGDGFNVEKNLVGTVGGSGIWRGSSERN